MRPRGGRLSASTGTCITVQNPGAHFAGARALAGSSFSENLRIRHHVGKSRARRRVQLNGRTNHERGLPGAVVCLDWPICRKDEGPLPIEPVNAGVIGRGRAHQKIRVWSGWNPSQDLRQGLLAQFRRSAGTGRQRCQLKHLFATHFDHPLSCGFMRRILRSSLIPGQLGSWKPKIP